MPMKNRLASSACVLIAAAAFSVGCETESNSRPQQCPPGQAPPGYYGGTGQPPPGYQPAPGQPPNPNAPPGTQPPAPGPALPAVGYDPINAVDINFLRGRAQAVMQELIAALDSGKASKVQGIPLIVDDRPGEV